MKTTLTTLALILLLAGCAQLGKHNLLNAQTGDDYWLRPGQAQPSGRAASLLLYADYLRNLSPSDAPRELDHVRQLAAKDNAFYRQLQYALALSVAGGDMRLQQQVMDGISREQRRADPELGALFNLLSANSAERRRLEADARRAEADARRSEADAKRADAEAKRADAEARRADELEKKVEAIKNIEKGLIQRDDLMEGKK